MDKLENYKVSFGKYNGKSIHALVKDKQYCNWINKNINGKEELKDLIKNYSKYSKMIINAKNEKLKSIQSQTFEFFNLPVDIQRKIFFMKRKIENMDFIKECNIYRDNYISRATDLNIRCRACGNCDKSNGFMYCYHCGQMSKQTKNKRSKEYLERVEIRSKNQVMDKMKYKYRNMFTRRVLPKLMDKINN